MKPRRDGSLSLRRLIRFHLSVLLVTVFVLFSLATYVTERLTIRASQDRRLGNIALSVPHGIKDSDLRSINIKLNHGRDDFVLTIWNGDRQVYRSHEDVALSRSARAGFANQDWHGERWIVFTRLSGPFTIQAAQSLDARRALATERALHVILPLLLLLPLAMLIVPLGVRRGLAPLTRMSRDLRDRDWHSLEPMQGPRDVEELVPLAQALDGLLARLQRASRLHQAFVADASHELRTPLAALQILLQMLEEATTPEQRQAAMVALREGVTRANRLSHQLLVTSRLDGEGGQGRPDLMTLSGVIEEAIIALSPLAASKDIDLFFADGPDGPIRGIAEDVSLLVTNLAENAIRYTQEGGRVVLALMRDGPDCVQMTVEDSGPGIPETERERVFDRFYRCPGSDTPGSGLGLAIVARVAERHQARVVLDDSDMGGLRVSVYWPSATRS